MEAAKKQDFDDIISKSIKNNCQCLGDYNSVKQIWENEKGSLEKATRLISHLPEDKIDVSELKEILVEIFNNDTNVLQNSKASTRTNIRRLILIYDYMKWGKCKELSN